MPFFTLDHTAGADFTSGRSTGLRENIRQAFEQQFRVDSAFALEAEIFDNLHERIKELEGINGQTYARPMFSSIMDLAEDPQRIEPNDRGAPSVRNFNELRRIDNDLVAAGLPSFSTIVQEVVKMQQEVEARTADIAERATTGGVIGQFIGGAAGSFTARDPLNLFTLPFGGVGRNAATRIASEMGLAAGIETVNQAVFVQPNRDFADLPDQSGVQNVAFAALGAGVFQGAGELVGAALARRRLRNYEREQTAFNQRVESYLQVRSNVPRARAALQLIEFDNAVKEASPYGITDAGLRRFEAELTEISNIFNGQTSTAIARVLPPVPHDFLEKAADFDIMREQRPDLFAKLDAAQEELKRANALVTNAEEAIPSIGDAVARIDEETGDLIRSLESDYDNPGITNAQRADIERRINTIVESLGEANVQRVMDEIDIQEKLQLKQLRKSRRAANQRYKDAYNAIEKERAAFKKQQAFLTGKQEEQAVDLLGYAIGGGAQKQVPLIGPRMSTQMLDQQSGFITRTAETKEEQLNRMTVIADSEMLDIGLDEPVDGNMVYLTPEGNTITFRQALDDIIEDQKLDEAVRSCAL